MSLQLIILLSLLHFTSRYWAEGGTIWNELTTTKLN